ncbi:hypothetical protein VUR80DRAFT_5712 [Thermomyces stellatus]
MGEARSNPMTSRDPRGPHANVSAGQKGVITRGSSPSLPRRVCQLKKKQNKVAFTAGLVKAVSTFDVSLPAVYVEPPQCCETPPTADRHPSHPSITPSPGLKGMVIFLNEGGALLPSNLN